MQDTRQYTVVVNGVVESIASFGTSNLYAKNQRIDGHKVGLHLATVNDLAALEAVNNAYWTRFPFVSKLTAWWTDHV